MAQGDTDKLHRANNVIRIPMTRCLFVVGISVVVLFKERNI